MNAIQRLNYFTSQFLIESDFQDEQSYHCNMRHLHNKSFHTFGVVGDGLVVTKSGDRQIKVGKGMAIDKDGREIVLLTDSDPINLSGNNTDVFITLQYTESLDVPDTTSGLTGKFRRTTEGFQIASPTIKPPADGSVIQLARVTLDSSGIITQINNDQRIWAGAMIASKSITTDQLADNAITNSKIAPNSISTAQIQNGAVTSAAIASQSVGTNQLADGAITTAKIAPNSVSTAQLQNGAVTGAAIASQSVGTAQLVDAAVTTAKIAPNSVGPAQLQNGAVTGAAIALQSVGNAQLVDGSISGNKVANNTITEAKLDPAVRGKLGIVAGMAISQVNGGLTSITSQNQVVVSLNVNVPAKGCVIVSVSGAVLNNTGALCSLTLSLKDPVQNLAIYSLQVPANSSIPFSCTRLFSFADTNVGTQNFQLVANFPTGSPTIVAPNLSALFIPG